MSIANTESPSHESSISGALEHSAETRLHPIAEDFFTYARNFFYDRNVGSIARSSRFLTRAVGRQIDFENTRSIVELGAGEGTVTRHLLERMSPRAKVYAFELNAALLTVLKRKITDSRLTALNSNAKEIASVCARRQLSPEAIVSGIPLTFFSESDLNKLMEDLHRCLAPNGRLILYQAWLPPFQNMGRCMNALKPFFTPIAFEDVYLNIPPLRVVVAEKIK